jgi:hypothetical protein
MALNNNELLIKNVRITTFGQNTLYEPKMFPGGTDPTLYFSVNGILAKNHPQIAEIEKKILEAAMTKWPQKGASILKAAKLIGKVPLRDGDAKAEYDGFEGNMFISARSKTRPSVFDGSRNPVTQGDENAPYDGCYANIIVSFYGYDKGNNGVGAGLKGVQFLRHGDRFSGGNPADKEDFDEIGAPDSGDDDLAA